MACLPWLQKTPLLLLATYIIIIYNYLNFNFMLTDNHQKIFEFFQQRNPSLRKKPST